MLRVQCVSWCIGPGITKGPPLPSKTHTPLPGRVPRTRFLMLSSTSVNPCAGAGENMNGSQFYLTLGDDLYSLDEKHTIFGEVAEGLEVLEAINDVPCDDDGRPLQNIR